MTMPLNKQEFAGIPTNVPGRLTADDFIYFTYDSDLIAFDPTQFDCVIQNDDGSFLNVSAGGQYGHLSPSVQLPAVRYSTGTNVLVLPKLNVANAPRFIGTLQRGKTYRLTLQGKTFAGPSNVKWTVLT